MTIKTNRVRAFLLRHIYEIWGSIDRKADIFLFPVIDILVFGLLTTYIEKFQLKSGIAGAIMGGIILWTLVYNITRDISFTLLEDAWNRNLYNMFSSPLQLSEVVAGTLIISVLKALAAIGVMLALAYGLFGFNLFQAGLFAAFYILNIFMFGWAFGFFTSSLILRFGTKVQAVSWSLILLIYPISGVFYPLSVLPPFLATVARFFSLSYIFEGLREILVNGTMPSGPDVILILVLNAVYLVFGVFMFVTGFRNAKNRGWFINPI